MIEEFNIQTGVPILFNTSFNLAGEPLVESLDDAVKALDTSRLEYLYCPENDLLIEVLNEKA
jgi:carbamoyltransferase